MSKAPARVINDSQRLRGWKNPRKRRSYIEFCYIIPFLVVVFLFSYLPLYGWRYAFHDYKTPFPLTAENFVGLKWFKEIVSNPTRTKDVVQVMINTFAMSGLSLAFSWFPMIFAIFLNEIKCKPFQKFVQTVTTLPNFISWTLVYAFAFTLFSSNGAVNRILLDLGWINKAYPFLKTTENIYFRMWLWLTWKNAGWAAIMYLAAITGIDEQMLEAAKVDGASRMQIILHITIPTILPTYFVLTMLNIANFLSNGMEQYYVFQNNLNKDYIQVLDLYVYNLFSNGANGTMYPLATAIGILKTVVSVVLLFITNTISKITRGESFI